MTFGTIEVEKFGVTTHRDTYFFEDIRAVSCRRPLFGGAVIVSFGFSGFGLAFADLLHLSELATLAVMVATILILGCQLGQLKLLSRALNGSELSGVAWGQYAHLNRIRAQIAVAIREKNEGANS